MIPSDFTFPYHFVSLIRICFICLFYLLYFLVWQSLTSQAQEGRDPHLHAIDTTGFKCSAICREDMGEKSFPQGSQDGILKVTG